MRLRAAILSTFVLGFLIAQPAFAEEPKRDLPYVELTGVVEDFTFHREWSHYYWREDFTFMLRDDAGKRHRVISREPTPWNDLRLGTTFPAVDVDWTKKPRVSIVGVTGVDRIPLEFYDLPLEGEIVTAFLVRLVGDAGDAPRDYYINNWFHRWGAEADRKVPVHFARPEPQYAVYGYLSDHVVPFDAASQKTIDKLTPDYSGVIYSARVEKADNEFGCLLRLVHLLGRHKKTLEYGVFHGDPAQLPKLDGRKPRMVDVTEASGISIAKNTGVGGTNPHAVAIEDFNGDGHHDLIVPTFGAPYIRYFQGTGNLQFKDATQGSGLAGFAGEGTGAAIADFNRDGKLDVYLTALRSGASRLFQGKGDGTFADVSEAAGVLIAAPARSCAASDIDGDGWTDLYVCCPEGPNRLFRNRGNGAFEEIARAAGVELSDRHSLGCAFGDIDGDGRDDLFVANYQSQPSALFKNLGGGKFRDVTAEAGLGRKASAVGCVLADVFNRGVLDLYVTTDSWLSGANATEAELLQQGHTVEPNVLYRNDGQGRFKPVDDATLRHKTLSHDAVLEDFDHDGLVEIYTGVDAIPTGNLFATSKGGNPLWTRSAGKWEEVGGAWDVDHQGNCVCVPAADLDGDGDLDLVLINFYSNVVVYRNDTNDKHWLQVRAQGKASNPDGIGAKIRVYAQTGAKEQLIGLREIQSGAGYCRATPLVAHFGLGPQPAQSYRIEVDFPASKTRVVKTSPPGQRIVVEEGNGK